MFQFTLKNNLSCKKRGINNLSQIKSPSTPPPPPPISNGPSLNSFLFLSTTHLKITAVKNNKTIGNYDIM